MQDWSPKLEGPAIAVLYDEWEKARQALGVRVLAYCIMPDQMHIVIWGESGENARKFLHRTISQTSRRLRPGGKADYAVLRPGRTAEFRIRPQPGFSIARITESGKPLKFSGTNGEAIVNLKAGRTYKIIFRQA